MTHETGQDSNIIYYTMPDGSFGKQASSVGDVAVPEGATLISEAEYNALMAQFEADRAARAAETAAAELAQAKADYEVLIGLGVPEATARRMSGYYPPEPTPEGP